jgi:hypothetical protein
LPGVIGGAGHLEDVAAHRRCGGVGEPVRGGEDDPVAAVGVYEFWLVMSLSTLGSVSEVPELAQVMSRRLVVAAAAAASRMATPARTPAAAGNGSAVMPRAMGGMPPPLVTPAIRAAPV